MSEMHWGWYQVFLFDKSNAKTRRAKEHRSIHQDGDGDHVIFGPIDNKEPRSRSFRTGTPFSRSLMGSFLERSSPPSRHGMNAKKHDNMVVIPWSPLMSHLMYHFWYPSLALGDHNNLKANTLPFNAGLGGKHIARFTSNPSKGRNHWKKDGGDVKIIDLEISFDPEQGIIDSTSSRRPDLSSRKMHPFLSLLRWKANRGKEKSHEESEKKPKETDNGFIQAHLDSSMVDKEGKSTKDNDGPETATHRPDKLSTRTMGAKQLDAKKLDPLGKDDFANDKIAEKPRVLGSQLQDKQSGYPLYEHLSDLLKPFASLNFPNDLEKYAGKLNDFSGLSNMLQKSAEVKKNDGDGETAKQTKGDNHGHAFHVEMNDGHTAADEEEGKNEDNAKDVHTTTEELVPREKNGGGSSSLPHAGNNVTKSNSVKPDGSIIKKSVKSKKSRMNKKIGNFPEDPSVKNEIVFEEGDNSIQNEATLIDNPHGKEKGQRYQDPFISLKSRLRSQAIYPQDPSFVLKQEQDNARNVNDDHKSFLATMLNNQRLEKTRKVFGDDGKGAEVKTTSRERPLLIIDKSITKDEGERIKRPAAKDDTNFVANVVKNSYGNDAIGNLYHDDENNDDDERSVLRKVRSNPDHPVYRSERAAVARKNGSGIEDAHREKSKHDAEAADKPVRDNNIVSDKKPTQHGPKETTVNEVKNDKGRLRPNNEGMANPGPPQSQQNESRMNLFREKKKKEGDSDNKSREPLPRPTPTMTTTKKEEPKTGGELFELYTAYEPANKTEVRRQKREKAQHVVLGILTIGIFVCLLVSFICAMSCSRASDPSLQRINSRTAIYMPHDYY